MAKAKESMKCTCSPGYFLAALVLYTLGLWALVSGLLLQWNYADATRILPWYFLGFLLAGLGKFAKWQACVACPVHGFKRY